jgi:hypothetical protein
MQADAPVSHAEKKVRLSEPELGQEIDERSDADSVDDEEDVASDQSVMDKIITTIYSPNIDSPKDPVDTDMILAVIKEISPGDLGLGGAAIFNALIDMTWKMANDTVHYGKSWRGIGRHIEVARGNKPTTASIDYYGGRPFDNELTQALVDKATGAFEKKGIVFFEIDMLYETGE